MLVINENNSTDCLKLAYLCLILSSTLTTASNSLKNDTTVTVLNTHRAVTQSPNLDSGAIF